MGSQAKNLRGSSDFVFGSSWRIFASLGPGLFEGLERVEGAEVWGV